MLKQPGFLEKIHRIICFEKRAVRREVSWILTNLTAGTSEQIQLLLVYPGFLQRVMEMAKADEPQVILQSASFPLLINLFNKIQKDSLWALCNITNHGTPEQIDCLIRAGFMALLVQQLNLDSDATMIAVSLEALHNILDLGAKIAKSGIGENPYLKMLDSLGGGPKLEKLQDHKASQVNANAVSILENFYDVQHHS